jgi:N-ethylmaleimide reductase
LFSRFTLGWLTLRNRIVMAPLTRSRSSEEGVPPDFCSGVLCATGLRRAIVSEATDISPQARGYEYTPGIWTDAQVASWRNVTRAVHEAGGVMVLQLSHTGRLSHPDAQPGAVLPVSSSAIKPEIRLSPRKA